MKCGTRTSAISRLIGESEDFSEYEDILALDAEQEKTLFNRTPRMTPEEAYDEAVRLGKGNVPEEIEKLIATDGMWSYSYALDVLAHSFPLGEPAIAKDVFCAYNYAVDVLHGRFELGEATIAEGPPQYACWYASHALRYGDIVPDSKRFPLGEPVIATSAEQSFAYCRDVLQTGDFDPHNRRFPLGEPEIARWSRWSYYYATTVLRNRFPAGEAAIFRDINFSKLYKMQFKIK